MPRTLEEMEADLEELREEQAHLRRSLRKRRAFTDNPLALSTDLDDLGSVKTYLTIEKPDQAPGTPPADVGYLYGHRTRKMTMGLYQIRAPDANPRLIWTDAGTVDVVWNCPVPSDWVSGTDITVNTLLLQTVTAGSPTVVMKSSISLLQVGDAYSGSNFENNVAANKALTQNVMVLQQRTITGASVAAADNIYWLLRRYGADAGDAVNSHVYAIVGAWIAYTAAF